jgi:hexokinase
VFVALESVKKMKELSGGLRDAFQKLDSQFTVDKKKLKEISQHFEEALTAGK